MGVSEELQKASDITQRIIELVKMLYGILPADKQRELLELLKDDCKKENRRKHARKSRSIPVAYATKNAAFMDRIRDIGGGGVFIESLVPFSKGQEVTLILCFPNYQSLLELKGEIVRTDARGVGVKFKDIDEHQTEMIQFLLENLKECGNHIQRWVSCGHRFPLLR